MSQADGSDAAVRENENSIVFEESPSQSGRNKPAIAFVNATGPITKNARVQRSIRNFVMRDHGKARRRGDKGKGREEAVAMEQVPAAPKLTVVANASPEYFSSVQLVKAAKSLYCAFPGCMELPAPTLRLLTYEGGSSYCNNHLHVTASGGSPVPSISRFSTGRIDPFIPYPVAMTPRVRQLVDHVFTDTPNRDIKFYRDTIFPTALVGGITFYQVLANLALYLRHAKPLENAQEYEMREELAHQARVFQLVNKKIAEKEATSDDVISAVAALACQSHVARDLRMFHVHMNGLKAIIAMRGGIHTLDSNDVIRHSLYWLDVNGNATEDLAPSWPIPLKLVPYRPALPPGIAPADEAQRISTTWRRLYPSQASFLDILDDTARFSIHLSSEEARTSGHVYTDVVFAGNLIIGLVHRLLSARSAIDIERPETTFQEATRLALLLFLAPIRRRFGIHPIDSRTQVQKLHAVLANDTADWTALGPLRLWVLSMGVLEAAEAAEAAAAAETADPELGWLVGEWARRALGGEVATAGQAETLFRGIMWIDTVHGVMFRERQERFFGRGPVLAPKP